MNDGSLAIDNNIQLIALQLSHHVFVYVDYNYTK